MTAAKWTESHRSTHFNPLNDREAAVIASAISRDEYHESNARHCHQLFTKLPQAGR